MVGAPNRCQIIHLHASSGSLAPQYPSGCADGNNACPNALFFFKSVTYNNNTYNICETNYNNYINCGLQPSDSTCEASSFANLPTSGSSSSSSSSSSSNGSSFSNSSSTSNGSSFSNSSSSSNSSQSPSNGITVTDKSIQPCTITAPANNCHVNAIRVAMPQDSSYSLPWSPSTYTAANNQNYYVCKYPNRDKLNCQLQSSSSSSSSLPSSLSSSLSSLAGSFNQEDCNLYDTQSNNLSHYICTGLDSNNFFPQSCTYYSNQYTTTAVASSTCSTTAPLSSSSAPSSSSASSGMNYCWITTCMHADGKTFTPPPSNASSSSSSTGSSSSSTGPGASVLCPEFSAGSAPISDPTIQVQILQACTPVSPNAPYSCTYRNATKIETLSTPCFTGTSQGTTIANCKITDLGVTYTWLCRTDPNGGGADYYCTITPGDNSSSSSSALYYETCLLGPIPGTAASTSCTVHTSNGSGEVHCITTCIINTGSSSGSQSLMTASCQSNGSSYCTFNLPECPATQIPTMVLPPDDISCDGTLIANSLLAINPAVISNAVTQMTYPLGLPEYEFVFYATGTGPNSIYHGAQCGGSGSSSGYNGSSTSSGYNGSSTSSGYNDSMACYL